MLINVLNASCHFHWLYSDCQVAVRRRYARFIFICLQPATSKWLSKGINSMTKGISLAISLLVHDILFDISLDYKHCRQLLPLTCKACQEKKGATSSKRIRIKSITQALCYFKRFRWMWVSITTDLSIV